MGEPIAPLLIDGLQIQPPDFPFDLDHAELIHHHRPLDPVIVRGICVASIHMGHPTGMSMVNLVRTIAGPAWYPEKAVLQTKPTSVHRTLPGLGQIDLKFRQKASGFAIPTKWLLRSTKPNSTSISNQRRTIGLLNKGEPTTTKLEILLTEIIGVGGICPTLKLKADLCDTSSRSLHRQLKLEGKTYQQILDGVRFERACGLLKSSENPIKEIAYQLGYSGPNNFIRSFKRLSGDTPTNYRRSHQAQI